MNSLEFFIYRHACSRGENIDLSSIPMMTKRKLSPAGKIAISTMLEVYDGDTNTDLVFASRYGELERVVKLIKQKQEENEISPAGFSFSVHNSTIGLFSLIKNIHNKYNSVAAGENSFSSVLLDAVMNKTKTLFCFAESVDRYESISILLGPEKTDDAIKVKIIPNSGNLAPNSFYDFLNGKDYICPLYIMTRADK